MVSSERACGSAVLRGGLLLGDAAREGATEVLVLEPVGVACLGQRAGEPAGPGPVGAGEADEEVALGVRGVGHSGCRWARVVASSPAAPYYGSCLTLTWLHFARHR